MNTIQYNKNLYSAAIQKCPGALTTREEINVYIDIKNEIESICVKCTLEEKWNAICSWKLYISSVLPCRLNCNKIYVRFSSNGAINFHRNNNNVNKEGTNTDYLC